MRIRTSAIFIACFLILTISCSTTQVKKSELPSWINAGKDVRYTNSFYITAAGEGASQDLSDKSAMLKIGEQIQVVIKGRVTAVQSEIKKGNKIESSHDITLLTETSVDIEKLEGLSIVSRYFDEKEKLHYSLAVLNREKASMGLEREVKESHESAGKYFEIAEGEREKGEIAAAMHNYIKAIDELKRIRPRENILHAIAGKGIKNEISLIDVEKKLTEVLSEVKVSVEIKVKNMGMDYESNLVASMITEGLANSGFNVVSSNCSSAPVAPVSKGEPEWKDKGSGAFDTPKGKMFFGVGSASGINNRSLLISTADNRARAEIAKIMETYVAVLAKDYMASTSGGADISKSSEEQHVEQTLKSFVQITLNGSEIIDRWKDPSDGTQFSLAKLDLTAFKDTLDKAKELNSKVRDYVKENAEKAHDELEKEIEKRK
jgi:hypothetical protein